MSTSWLAVLNHIVDNDGTQSHSSYLPLNLTCISGLNRNRDYMHRFLRFCSLLLPYFRSRIKLSPGRALTNFGFTKAPIIPFTYPKLVPSPLSPNQCPRTNHKMIILVSSFSRYGLSSLSIFTHYFTVFVIHLTVINFWFRILEPCMWEPSTIPLLS